MGGAPIGAGGHYPLLLEAKGTCRGTQFGDNSYLTFCSYHAFTLMSTPYFVLPLAKKWGSNFLLASLAEFVPHFQNRGAAPVKTYCQPQLLHGVKCDRKHHWTNVDFMLFGIIIVSGKSLMCVGVIYVIRPVINRVS